MILRHCYCLMLIACALFLPVSGVGMQNYCGRVADPVSGAAVKGAQVYLFHAGTQKKATMFGNPLGKGAPKSMVTADAAGRYSFYAPNGRYRIRIVAPDKTLLYDHDDVVIYDPRDPQKFISDGDRPALSLYTTVELMPMNLPLIMQKNTETDELIGQRWYVQAQHQEYGWALMYNIWRRGDPPFTDKQIDPAHPVQTFGSNDADDGIFFLPGIYITGGGFWHSEAHTITTSLRLPSPDDNESPVGIDMIMSAPTGLKPGDVVALSLDKRSHVAPVSVAGARLPFVVSKVNKTGTFVMASGLAWIKVMGDVDPGDILVTSIKPRYAKKDNANSDPAHSLGVAVGKSVNGKVLTRILRVAR